jgi:ABC-type uncharacterized transport system substrate-binding protein
MKIFRLWLAWLALLIGLGSASQANAEHNILVLHAYHHEYPWSKKQHQGFMQTLTKTPLNGHIVTEYLNTKLRPFDTEYQQFFADYLKQKYAGFSIDLVYTTDDNALLFMERHRSALFPDAKVVFSGVNDSEGVKKLDRNVFTGVVEHREVAENIRLIRLFKPLVSEVIVVGDASNTYEAIKQEILASNPFADRIKIRFAASEQIEAVREQLAAFNPGFVLLSTIGHLKDSEGRTLPLRESVAQIKEGSRHVIMTMEDSYMLRGVVGGYMTSGFEQGRIAAEKALAYMKGKSLESVGIEYESPNRYVFDRNEIKRSKLFIPAEINYQATVLNEEPGFFEANSSAVIAVILLLIAAVAFLTFRRCD